MNLQVSAILLVALSSQFVCYQLPTKTDGVGTEACTSLSHSEVKIKVQHGDRCASDIPQVVGQCCTYTNPRTPTLRTWVNSTSTAAVQASSAVAQMSSGLAWSILGNMTLPPPLNMSASGTAASCFITGSNTQSPTDRTINLLPVTASGRHGVVTRMHWLGIVQFMLLVLHWVQ